jgi:hypothetical protein
MTLSKVGFKKHEFNISKKLGYYSSRKTTMKKLALKFLVPYASFLLQELDLKSNPKPFVFILHTFLSAKVHSQGAHLTPQASINTS